MLNVIFQIAHILFQSLVLKAKFTINIMKILIMEPEFIDSFTVICPLLIYFLKFCIYWDQFVAFVL